MCNSNNNSGESLLNALLAECRRRIDAGDAVDREAFKRENASFGDELDEFFASVDLTERLASDTFVEGSSKEVEKHADEFDVTVRWRDGPPQRLALSPTTDLAGYRLGNYELIEPVGRGGMGVVYKARQVRLDRIVAVKLILAGRLASSDNVRRFDLEAKAAGKLQHPNIVSVHQTGEFDGQHFYSMDYIDGKTLADMSRQNPLPSETAARYMKQVAGAVQYAHTMRILHRDLKPSNVLIDEKDQAQITDFGLAKQLGMDVALTDSGGAMGTPGFMSPEQAAGKRREIGSASDIYSLGAILYQLLTGRPPFRGESAMATISDVINKEPVSPRTINSNVHRDLEAICLKCMAKDPYRRYGSAQEVEEELDRFLASEPVNAKPLGKVARTWNWIRDVPLVAALIGRRFAGTTAWHHRAQWSVLAIPFLVFMVAIGMGQLPTGLPEVITIGSAERDGMYDGFCLSLAEQDDSINVRIEKTQGSIENLQMLRDGTIHVALAQVETLRSDDVIVVAPLFREVVYVLARKDCGIDTMNELKNRLADEFPAILWMGLEKSGMRVSAEAVLSRYGIDTTELDAVDCPLVDVIDDQRIDVAVVTAGSHNLTLRGILESGDFKLISLPNVTEQFSGYPTFRHHEIEADTVPAAVLGIGGQAVDSVATVSVLAVSKNESELLVTTVLELVYSDDSLLMEYGLISKSDAAAWVRIMNVHKSAREFFIVP